MNQYLSKLCAAWKKTQPEWTHQQALDSFRQTIQQLEVELKASNPEVYRQMNFQEAYEVIDSTVFFTEAESDLMCTYGWLITFVKEVSDYVSGQKEIHEGV